MANLIGLGARELVLQVVQELGLDEEALLLRRRVGDDPTSALIEKLDSVELALQRGGGLQVAELQLSRIHLTRL